MTQEGVYLDSPQSSQILEHDAERSRRFQPKAQFINIYGYENKHEPPNKPSPTHSNSNRPSSSPRPNRKLAITHIRQLPRLSAEPTLLLLLVCPTPSSASNKATSHEMVISSMCVSELRVLHQPRNRTPESRAAIVSEAVFNTLSELERPALRGRLLRKAVSVLEHGRPAVTVEVVHGAAGADDKVALLAQLVHGAADAHVEVRIEAGVHRNESRGRALVGEHADEDEVSVVDPFESRIRASLEACVVEDCEDALAGGKVCFEFVVDVFGRVDVGDGGFTRFGVHGDFDCVFADGVPVGAHHDYAFDVVGESRVAAGFPVVCGFGLFA
jgi:hypothetical protein